MSLLLLGGLFLLFYEGFQFIVENMRQAGAPYHAQTVRFVFHLFFASLNVMLVFSSGIILFTGLVQVAGNDASAHVADASERIVFINFKRRYSSAVGASFCWRARS